jgi:hypothetical protein
MYGKKNSAYKTEKKPAKKKAVKKKPVSKGLRSYK